MANFYLEFFSRCEIFRPVKFFWLQHEHQEKPKLSWLSLSIALAVESLVLLTPSSTSLLLLKLSLEAVMPLLLVSLFIILSRSAFNFLHCFLFPYNQCDRCLYFDNIREESRRVESCNLHHVRLVCI